VLCFAIFVFVRNKFGLLFFWCKTKLVFVRNKFRFGFWSVTNLDFILVRNKIGFVLKIETRRGNFLICVWLKLHSIKKRRIAPLF
jgi:hypothetical protein